MSKYIFLDIDGVLVHDDTAVEEEMGMIPRPVCVEFHGHTFYARFDRGCIARLNHLVAETQASVVLTSTWRTSYPLSIIELYMKKHGAAFNLVGKTVATLDGMHRVNEISRWVYDNEVESFVIIDDQKDMLHYSDRLVHVDDGWNWGGIQDHHVEQAIALLSPAEVRS